MAIILRMSDYAKRHCSVAGCERQHFGHGLCGMHYQRWIKSGSTDDPRPRDHGQRKKHPLWKKWSVMKGRVGGVQPVWIEDFWRFVADVGERPEGHSLEVIRPYEPLGPDNFEWRPMGPGLVKPRTRQRGLLCSVDGCDRSARSGGLCSAHYTRWVKLGKLDNPTPRTADLEKRRAKARRNHLRRYGLTQSDVERMRKSQEGRCLVCHAEAELVIDHCHTTGVVRGLLCHHCNRGIGHFQDDPTRLWSAIQYLSRTQEVGKIS